jgi:hypothetical protein
MRVSYGHKNSLSAFIETVQNVLGEQKNVMIYVDDTGEYNKSQLKPYRTEDDSNSHQN